ncbi:MAG TPA: transporter substrate-binding domain-containing protein [Anaerolineales bacterium]|nr:transporter substrate-binding domain-containing protein [Anaerolineales bacterium]
MLNRKVCLPLLLLTVLVISALAVSASAHAKQSAPLTGQKLRVGIAAIAPFIINAGGHYTGYSIDVWEDIAKSLGVETEYVPFNSVNDAIQAVQSGQVDLALSAISMTVDRERLVDLTQPYYLGGLRILTSPQQAPSLFDLIAPLLELSVERVLLGALLAALVMAHVIYLMEHNSNPRFPKGYLRGVWEGFWWLISIVATGEYGDKETQRASRRIVTIIFWLLGVVFIAQFTASLTTALTLRQLSNTNSSAWDLLSSKQVVAVADSDATGILSAHKIPFQTVPVINEAYVLLEQHKANAIVDTDVILEYYASHEGSGKTAVVGPVFGHVAIGIAVPIGSPLRKSINESILAMSDSGTLSQINEIWFGNEK